MANANGGDIFIYPGFLLVIANDNDFGLIDFIYEGRLHKVSTDAFIA